MLPLPLDRTFQLFYNLQKYFYHKPFIRILIYKILNYIPWRHFILFTLFFPSAYRNSIYLHRYYYNTWSGIAFKYLGNVKFIIIIGAHYICLIQQTVIYFVAILVNMKLIFQQKIFIDCSPSFYDFFF